MSFFPSSQNSIKSDGSWSHLGASYEHATGETRFYLNGRPSGAVASLPPLITFHSQTKSVFQHNCQKKYN